MSYVAKSKRCCTTSRFVILWFVFIVWLVISQTLGFEILMGLGYFLDINLFILVWVLLIWYGFCCFLVFSWVLIGLGSNLKKIWLWFFFCSQLAWILMKRRRHHDHGGSGAFSRFQHKVRWKRGDLVLRRGGWHAFGYTVDSSGNWYATLLCFCFEIGD